MPTNPTPFQALQTAVELLGGQSATARLCEVTQGAVFRWLNTTHQLPAEMVLRVEAATGVSRHALRPDIYPLDMPPAPDQPWNALDTGAARETFANPRRKAPDNNAAGLPDTSAHPNHKPRPSGR